MLNISNLAIKQKTKKEINYAQSNQIVEIAKKEKKE